MVQKTANHTSILSLFLITVLGLTVAIVVLVSTRVNTDTRSRAAGVCVDLGSYCNNTNYTCCSPNYCSGGVCVAVSTPIPTSISSTVPKLLDPCLPSENKKVSSCIDGALLSCQYQNNYYTWVYWGNCLTPTPHLSPTLAPACVNQGQTCMTSLKCCSGLACGGTGVCARKLRSGEMCYSFTEPTCQLCPSTSKVLYTTKDNKTVSRCN